MEEAERLADPGDRDEGARRPLGQEEELDQDGDDHVRDHDGERRHHPDSAAGLPEGGVCDLLVQHCVDHTADHEEGHGECGRLEEV